MVRFHCAEGGFKVLVLGLDFIAPGFSFYM